MRVSNYKKVRAIFYFGMNGSDFRDERLNMARGIFLDSDALDIVESTEVERGTEVVTMTALVPLAIANLHHGFESKFNKAWPEGCGAGVLEDA